VIPGIRDQKIEALDNIIATHNDPDHTAGLNAVLQSIPMTGTGAFFDRDRRWPITMDAPTFAARYCARIGRFTWVGPRWAPMTQSTVQRPTAASGAKSPCKKPSRRIIAVESFPTSQEERQHVEIRGRPNRPFGRHVDW
jgi:hypothetical protein